MQRAIRDGVDDASEKLVRGVGAMIEQGRWAEFVRFSSKFRMYSPRNVMLIYVQARERDFVPTRVAGYVAWKKLGRSVRRGESGLAIFSPICRSGSEGHEPRASSSGRGTHDERSPKGSDAPPASAIVGFRKSYVFDISQTDGEDLDEPLTPLTLTGDALPEVEAFAQSYLIAQGYCVRYVPLQGMNGRTDVGARLVEIDISLPPAQRVKTLIHETAHAVLHVNGAPDRALAEVEAEATAYLFLDGIGFDSSQYSFPYIVRWASGEMTVVAEGLQRAMGLAFGLVGLYENLTP
ncbi:MAG: ArdC-like ssDNA-binding domain-containing protein [Acidimicrobiales bacterium]